MSDVQSLGCGLLLFFFNDTATTEIYTLSLHDALPICGEHAPVGQPGRRLVAGQPVHRGRARRAGPVGRDRKSTRLNSSHQIISYAVFCLKKKKQTSKVCTLFDTLPRARTLALTHRSKT